MRFLAASLLLALSLSASLAHADSVDDLARQAVRTVDAAGVAAEQAALGALDDGTATATGAVQQGEHDANQAVVDAAHAAGSVVTDAAADATGTGVDAVQEGATTANRAVGAGEGLATSSLGDADQAARDAIRTAGTVPGTVQPPLDQAFGVLQAELRIGGDYLQRRIHSLPLLDTPWLQGVSDTYSPYLAQLDGLMRVDLALHDLSPIIVIADPASHIPAPGQLAQDTAAFVDANVPGSVRWVQDSADDTAATAQAMADAAQ